MSLYLASLRAVNRSSGKCNNLAATNHGEFMTLVAGKRRSLLMAGDDDKVFITRNLNVTPKTTLRSGKSEAQRTIIRLRSKYYFVKPNYWRTQSIAWPLCNSNNNSVATCYSWSLNMSMLMKLSHSRTLMHAQCIGWVTVCGRVNHFGM